ncbi:DUF1810 domain-containing protein [Luteibacter sp.]|uniref:DUF1810 domain-containing protein n=1 Tax=Luteibacter sp. TaxID=1886636 RepID=UPI003F80BF17
MNDISLDRFVEAQERHYDNAIRELRSGKKQTHWMWFIFPQLRGLGASEESQYFGVNGKDEAEAYINHDLLRGRLIIATETVLQHANVPLREIFPFPDDLKFISCMTLFAVVANKIPSFDHAIAKFGSGHRDVKTIELLEGK